ncbi:aldolase [Streptomyces sp. 3MP-14]|uniref:Aldolase n=1 Tax=Streptomyces mimosae TaxID=2586635 RepID=A0A5N6AAJ3_9ACTN|nr:MULTISPECIES: aldolase [Streptomyces]KAB8164518.1 aldolase [Streptomyces mimosae]KAB8175434.1 aldolase [Streptomyces sp. 3MP-14]
MTEPANRTEAAEPSNDAEARARSAIVELGRALYDRGITPGRTGNLSVRIGDRLLMTPTNACLGRLDPDRLSLVGPAGELLAGDRPSKELALHQVSYRRHPDVAAVAHVHSTHAVAVSCLNGLDPARPLPVLTAYFAMRVGPLPLVGYFPPGDPGLARALAETPPEARCALLAHHGSLAAAPTLEAAVDAVEEIEETARLALLLHGRDARTLTARQAAALYPRRRTENGR